jgi:hypothetical protein
LQQLLLLLLTAMLQQQKSALGQQQQQQQGVAAAARGERRPNQCACLLPALHMPRTMLRHRQQPALRQVVQQRQWLGRQMLLLIPSSLQGLTWLSC